MVSKEIERLVQSILNDPPGEHPCCKDGTCSDGLCVIHNKEGVRSIVHNGAARVTAGMGIEAAGGIETDLARLIDHTLLKPDATKEQITKLCAEAKKYNFASVCINPCYVSLCAKLLRDTPVKVCTVIGFPLGATSTAAKAFEGEQALRDGANELDMVMNVGMLKSAEYEYVENDIFAVVTTPPDAFTPIADPTARRNGRRYRLDAPRGGVGDGCKGVGRRANARGSSRPGRQRSRPDRRECQREDRRREWRGSDRLKSESHAVILTSTTI